LQGGVELVSSGVAVQGTVVSGGGTLLLSGGTDEGATVSSGGTLTVSSGGTAVTAAIDGGLVLLASGGSALGGLTFSGSGGVLQIDASTSGALLPAAPISNFAQGDAIDLRGVAFVSGATATVGSGSVLTVSDGGHSYTLMLNAGANLAPNTYVVSGDGSGGSIVTVLSGISVSSGQTIQVSSGQTAPKIVVASGTAVIGCHAARHTAGRHEYRATAGREASVVETPEGDDLAAAADRGGPGGRTAGRDDFGAPASYIRGGGRPAG
jgi:autotransporter passenger strand-loop-strand repeat protein